MGNYKEVDKNGFEVTNCGRCGGCGQYSFNLMHGSMCYGCRGTGKKYTKRCNAARELFIQLRSRKVEDIKVGDVVFENGWRTVTDIGSDDLNPGFIKLGFKGLMLHTWPGKTILVDGLFESAKAQALEFQDTLTTAGKPKKR